jgi:hypothetical protein
MHDNEELPLHAKVKIISTMILVAALAVTGTARVVDYQRNQKAKQQKNAQIAAALLKQQTGNVEKLKATLPLFKQTKQGENMLITKVRQEDLPTTITAGLDETQDPNPVCTVGVSGLPGQWFVTKLGGSVAENVDVANVDAKNGWDVSEGGVISIPALSPEDYGKYIFTIGSGEACDEDDQENKMYVYTFKIVPPCPTSVTLTCN